VPCLESDEEKKLGLRKFDRYGKVGIWKNSRECGREKGEVIGSFKYSEVWGEGEKERELRFGRIGAHGHPLSRWISIGHQFFP